MCHTCSSHPHARSTNYCTRLQDLAAWFHHRRPKPSFNPYNPPTPSPDSFISPLSSPFLQRQPTLCPMLPHVPLRNDLAIDASLLTRSRPDLRPHSPHHQHQPHPITSPPSPYLILIKHGPHSPSPSQLHHRHHHHSGVRMTRSWRHDLCIASAPVYLYLPGTGFRGQKNTSSGNGFRVNHIRCRHGTRETEQKYGKITSQGFS